MEYVPLSTEWYVAELVEEIRVEGHDGNVVHKNLILVRADSPDAAYVRALQLGREAEGTYQNPQGKAVTSIFRGLGYLDVLHDGLEDGAELLYQKRSFVSEEEIIGWVRSKQQLNLFRDWTPAVNDPNYSSKDIVDEASKLIEHESEV